jgi:MbtH protein
MEKIVADVAELYDVLINEEQQYSIWPSDKVLPLGWVKVSERATKDECLGYIREQWTDMRPLSLRKLQNCK